MMRITELLAIRMLDQRNSIAPQAPSAAVLPPGRLKGISGTLRTLAVYGLSICFLGTASSVHAASAEDGYAQSVFKLVKAHEDGLPRLIAPAEGTAKALIAGGAFYLGGDPGWIAEGDGRAGGLTMVRPLPLGTPAPSTEPQPSAPEPGTWLSASTLPVKGDVVWIAYLPADYAQNAAVAAELESRVFCSAFRA